MRVLSKNEVIVHKLKIVSEIAAGAVFIYPTDTIYGIGCDATNDKSVRRIREIKQRDAKPFSIIAPSIDWIKENCELNDKAKSWLLKLPGPYTLILPLRNNSAVCAQTNMGVKTIGVRMPNHWISDLVSKFGKPLVTTSVNTAGAPPSTTLEQLQSFSVDFIIFDGELAGKPSSVIDAVTGRVIR